MLQVPHVHGILQDLSFVIGFLSTISVRFIHIGTCGGGGLLSPPGRGSDDHFRSSVQIGCGVGLLVLESFQHPRSRRLGPQPRGGHCFSHGLSLLAGAHPHGLLLQDQKIPALPGGKQAGPLHAPGAEGEPDHGGGKELAQVPGKAAVSFGPSPLLTEHLVGAQSC